MSSYANYFLRNHFMYLYTIKATGQVSTYSSVVVHTLDQVISIVHQSRKKISAPTDREKKLMQKISVLP